MFSKTPSSVAVGIGKLSEMWVLTVFVFFHHEQLCSFQRMTCMQADVMNWQMFACDLPS